VLVLVECNPHRLIEALVDVARQRGCYKVILDCSEANQAFYEKCGLTRKEVQMVRQHTLNIVCLFVECHMPVTLCGLTRKEVQMVRQESCTHIYVHPCEPDASLNVQRYGSAQMHRRANTQAFWAYHETALVKTSVNGSTQTHSSASPQCHLPMHGNTQHQLQQQACM
jgi:hypothetical protein